MVNTNDQLVLILKDNDKFCQRLKAELEPDSTKVLIAQDTGTAEKLLEKVDPDVFILDLDVEEETSFSLIGDVKQQDEKISLVALGKTRPYHVLEAIYNAGVDSYLKKPFSLNEVLVLVRKYLKKPRSNENIIRISNLVINIKAQEAFRGGKYIDLTSKEFELLMYLVKNLNRVISKEEIARNVWKEGFERGTNIISVYISYLRKKVDSEFDQKIIQTRVGRGYLFRV